MTLTNVTVNTVDISEYPDFIVYGKFWFKDNYGISPNETGGYLGISQRTVRLVCCQILTQAGTFISISMLQHIINIELSTDEVKETFAEFIAEIRQSSKSYKRECEGYKTSPQYWVDMLEKYPDFSEEFKRVFSNSDILEADGFTPEVLEETYVDTEIALPRD